MSKYTWWMHGNHWLIGKANEHYAIWRAGKEGQKYKGKFGTSPYQFGYSQPDWMEDARKALGNNDEEWFKAIKLANL